MSFVRLSSCFLLFTATSAFADSLEVSVKPGDDAILPCQAPTGVIITVLEWTRSDLRSDDYVFLYRNARPYEKYQHELFRGRVALKDPKMTEGTVSVVLSNISTSDTGAYTCCITVSDMERFSHAVKLTVDAPGLTAAAEAGGKLEKLYEAETSENVGLVAASCAAAAAVVAVAFGIICVGFIIFRKHKVSGHQPACDKTLYKPACDKPDELQQT